MLDRFVFYFKSFEFIKDLFLIILGAFLMFLFDTFQLKRKQLRGKKKMERIMEDYLNEGILSLANAYPHYESRNIYLDNSNERFFLSFPDNYKNTFNCKEKDIIFTPTGTLKDLGETLKIANFPELIEKHRLLVAQEFLNRENGRSLFNNEKFGIRSMLLDKSSDHNEDSKLHIKFYLTDYFTHKVMRSLYHELRDTHDNFRNLGRRIEDLDISRYYPFLTSFGIVSLLCLKENSDARIVLVKRSKYISNMDKDRWHVSMNEGLSTTDLDTESKSVSLNQAVLRGYLEELGINYNNHQIYNEFRDVLLSRENFEIGITSFATTNMSVEDFRFCFEGAEDSSLETTGDFVVIPYSHTEIKRFIKKHNTEMTSSCRYCLEMCLSRLL